MRFAAIFCAPFLALISVSCGSIQNSKNWKSSVDFQATQLGYRNWIVIAEASFPAHSRPGIRQVNADAEVPEVLDYVLGTLEKTQHVRPKIYQTRELRSIENDFAPGIDEFRKNMASSLHAHETTELDHEALLTLLESSTLNLQVLVIRTPTALPYSSIFIELQHGYWDAESEDRLRKRIQLEKMPKPTRPIP